MGANCRSPRPLENGLGKWGYLPEKQRAGLQKLLKLGEVDVKAEEEPAGEAIVGFSREVLRPLGTGTTFHPDELPLGSSIFGQQAP